MACMHHFIDFVTADEYVLLADLIEIVLPCTSPEILKLHKDYKVVEGVSRTFGKWPDMLGNGFYID